MKKRDDQITLRLAGTLRAALEDAAAADERGLSDFVRKVLIDYAAKHVIERAGVGTP